MHGAYRVSGRSTDPYWAEFLRFIFAAKEELLGVRMDMKPSAQGHVGAIAHRLSRARVDCGAEVPVEATFSVLVSSFWCQASELCIR